MQNFVFLFLIGLLGLIILSVSIERSMEPALLVIAAEKAEQYAKVAIADAVTKRIAQQGVDFRQIAVLDKDERGNIRAINYNFKEYSRIIGETTARVQTRLKEFEQDGINFHIPLGVATHSTFLSSWGPQIPVSFIPIGAAKTKLETKLQQAGINMVLATVYLSIEVNLEIVIPFSIEEKTVTTQIPITESLIVGKVPEYLYNNADGRPDVPLKAEN
nr:sporulation protein YunB [Brevibacillus fulvus]